MYVPDLNALVGSPVSELQDVLTRFHADSKALGRRYPIEFSPAHVREFGTFHDEWAEALAGLDFESLSPAGRVDYLLLARRIESGRLRVEQEQVKYDSACALLPFADIIIELAEARLAIVKVDPEHAGAGLSDALAATQKLIADLPKGTDPSIAARAADYTDRLKKIFEDWLSEREGFDPVLSWWIAHPAGGLKDAMDAYVKMLREDIVGQKEGTEPPVTSVPMGGEALAAHVAAECLAYTPDELFDIAVAEMDWCESQMDAVAGEMGFAGDGAAAIEKIKSMHVPPGEQPFLARDLVVEAIDYLDANDLVTIPPHARRIWRQQMIKPETQNAYPFLWGGESIGTSFSHVSMPHQAKLMAMRSNNIPFLRATVHHEVIPGHHLQMYMGNRSASHRKGYGTPFCGEGWPLYWEILLYRLGFPPTPEDRLGFMFWRMYRCARVVVVFGFHLGRLSIDECLDLIINRVGHENASGTAQVRWLISGGSGALYGAAYMLGALQLLSLRRELVDSGRMTDRQFHDAIMAENSMPIELLRAAVAGHPLSRDYRANWRFYDDHVQA